LQRGIEDGFTVLTFRPTPAGQDARMQRLPRITRLIGHLDASASPAVRNVIALGLAALSLVLLQVLNALVPGALSFALFYPTVLVAAVFCGAGPGFAALAAIVTWEALTPAAGLWARGTPQLMAFNLTLFTLVASFLALIGAALRASLIARIADTSALTASEETLRLAVDAGELGLWSTDLQSRTSAASPRGRALMGFAHDERISPKAMLARIDPADRARVDHAISRAMDPFLRAVCDVDFRIRHPATDEVRWVQVKGAARFGSGGRAVRLHGTLLDVSARKAREAALQDFAERLEQRVAERTLELSEATTRLAESEARYRGYCDTVEDILFTMRVEPDGTFVHEGYNSFGERRIGLTNAQMVGQRLPGVMPPEMWSRVGPVLRAAASSRAGPGAPFRTTERLAYPAGEGLFDLLIVPLRDDTGRVVRLIGSSREITEQAHLEEELRQAQKMQAIGQLAGGVAHDFNNLLTAITGNLELLRDGLPEGRAQQWVASAMGAAQRAATLTRQLLAFSRKQRLERRPEDANAVLRGLRDLLGRTLGPDIVLRLDLQSDVWLATMDRNQTELALLNLAVNARDAMPRGGLLTLRTRNVNPLGTRELPAGSYVEIAVIDTGTGMPPEVQARAFEPFFTTKETGKGTGLGLSQVYGLARQSGGIAEIASEPGRGTTVRLLLPRATSAAPDDAMRAPAPTEAAQAATVLVVDDDDDVRTVASELLRGAGFTVNAVVSASAALLLLEAGYTPAALMADIVMPEMNGTELAMQARALRPGLPVLFTSGYPDPALLGLSIGDDPVLRKPFSGADLVARVQELTRGGGLAAANVVRFAPRLG
jgi:PAS domain S-box-containing protein